MAQAEPSPIVNLNRAVAVAMRDDPAVGLQLINDILAQGDLTDYHYLTQHGQICADGWGKRLMQKHPINKL